jgi:membrane protease YdiL (CAAX protease family)
LGGAYDAPPDRPCSEKDVKLKKRMLNRIVRPHLQFSFFTDVQFQAAVLLAPLSLILLSWLAPGWNQGIQPGLFAFLVMVTWQPLIEELLFRGIVQGQLQLKPAFRNKIGIISVANLMTSLLFVLAHLANHSPAWAMAVAIPSMIFGHFRDRHHTLLPCILLHSFYNFCYLAIGSLHYATY